MISTSNAGRNSMLAVSQGYPSDKYPHQMTFVHVLMQEFERQGLTPTVVAPHERFVVSRYPQTWLKDLRRPPLLDSYEGVQVIRPVYFSLPAKRLLTSKVLINLRSNSFSKAAMKAAEHISEPPTFCYVHHIYPGGVGALALAEFYGVPSVAVLGGSIETNERQLGKKEAGNYLGRFDLLIAVSEAIKDQCVTRHGVDESSIAVFHNGIDPEVFYPQDREAARVSLGLPTNDIILGFVGRFVDGKGPLRVLEAMKGLDGVKAVFLGKGPQNIEGPQVLHAGPVPHGDIPKWLAAVDSFVLPTISEGSCNAIIEAMACGLPIITSDIPSNREILDSSTSILVEPRSVEQLRDAIISVVEDADRRLEMGRAALKKASSFHIDARVEGMQSWLMKKGVLSPHSEGALTG